MDKGFTPRCGALVHLFVYTKNLVSVSHYSNFASVNNKLQNNKTFYIMNRNLLLTALMTLLSISVNAQMQRRMVLIEEFSNTGCSPCAYYSPVLDSVVSYRLGDVISIKYHGAYPDRNDIFYLNQKEDMDKRLNFYNVSAFPTAIVNGIESDEARTESGLHKWIDNQLNTESPFTISMQASVADHRLSVKAVTTVSEDITNGNLRLFVCAIEEYYENAAVFHNGETHVRNIMRKMLTGGDGHMLATDFKAGTDYTYDTTWDIEQFGSEAQLGVVAFLQDMETRQVVATAYVPRKYDGQDQMALMNLEGTPDNICTPLYFGNVTFRNQGSNDITGATLNVKVNGTTRQYAWSGNIATLEKARLDFNDFTEFTLNTDSKYNSVEVWFSDINGTGSESNHMKSSFSNATAVKESAQLKIYTDKKPEEIEWKLLSSAGDVIDRGGPYTEARHHYTHLAD